MERKHGRLGIMLFAMIGILIVSVQNNNLIMALVGIFGIPVLFTPYLIEDWYLPYRKKKKEEADEAFRAAVDKEVQKMKQQYESEIALLRKEAAETVNQARKEVKRVQPDLTADSITGSGKKEEKKRSYIFDYDKVVRMLGDLQISDGKCLSKVFCFSDVQLEEITSEFFSGDIIRNIDGKVLSPEEKNQAVRQIIGYGRRWHRGAKIGTNSKQYICMPGSLSHIFNEEDVESFCLDGGNYMADGYDNHKDILKFCFDAGTDWEKDIFPRWKNRWETEKRGIVKGEPMVRQDRMWWGYDGELDDGIIEAKIINQDRLYLKNPFGMGGVFYYEYKHVIS